MPKVTRATASYARELESHATTLNRSLEYLHHATENARQAKDYALMQWLDKESKRLTRELARVHADRRMVQEELAEV